MKHEDEMKYEDMAPMKEKRRGQRVSGQGDVRDSLPSKAKGRRKKRKKFVFNQNFDFDNMEIYDEE